MLTDRTNQPTNQPTNWGRLKKKLDKGNNCSARNCPEKAFFEKTREVKTF